jgi:HEAT repeat protein
MSPRAGIVARTAAFGLALILAVGAMGVAAGCSNAPDRLKSSDPKEVTAAIREIAAWDNAKAVGLLKDFVATQGDEMLAIQAIRSLGLMFNEDAYQALEEIASSCTRSALRQEAVTAFGQNRNERFLPTLRKVVDLDPDTRVRGSAIAALAKYRNMADIPLFLSVANKETDPYVQGQAVGAMEKLLGMGLFGYSREAPAEKRREAIDRMVMKVRDDKTGNMVPQVILLAESLARIEAAKKAGAAPK